MQSVFDKGFLLPTGSVNVQFVKTFSTVADPIEQDWYRWAPGDTLSEKMYIQHVLHDTEPAKCIQCGGPVKFISYAEGYRRYCSNICRAKGTAAQAEKTCLERYGVRRPAQHPTVRARMRQTCLEHHGVENIFLDTRKVEAGRIKKYGSLENLQQHRKRVGAVAAQKRETEKGDYHQKTKLTNLERYGHVCSIHGPTVWAEVQQTKRRKYFKKLSTNPRILEKVILRFSEDDYVRTVDASTGEVIRYPWTCVVCGTDFEDYIANGNIPRCPTCYPPSVCGVIEREIADWIKNTYSGVIIENTRRILPDGKELDIYLPDARLAIELNELYWHSENGPSHRGEQYHLNKTVQCEAMGIQLLHIFEHEWLNKKSIIQSMIQSRLNIGMTRIGARQCTIVSLTSQESQVFFEANHIQGYAPAAVRVGLQYDGEVVAALLVSKNRFREGTYEIVRFATKTFHRIPGALSKLWKTVLPLLPESCTVLSYADRRYFTGGCNTEIGFVIDHINPPGFGYTKDYKTIENRLKYQKHKLQKKFPTLYSEQLTEWEIMQLAGYDRVWDCGTVAYTFTQ